MTRVRGALSGLCRRYRIARYERVRLAEARRERNAREHLQRLEAGIPDHHLACL
jgi:hypothetical protein